MRPAIALALLLLGCPPSDARGPERVRVVDGAIEAEALLMPQVTAARAAGAIGLEVVGGEILGEGEQLGGFVAIPADACLLAIANPGGSLSDVDLFVYADDGDRLAADESPAAEAAALICPPHPGRAYVVARAMSGAGMVALGVMEVPAGKADAVARAVRVRGRPGEDTGKLAAWPGLERKIRERRERLGSAWEDVRRVALPVDPRAETALSLAVDDNRCLDLFVVPSDEVAAIDVQLVDAGGRVMGQGKPSGRDRGIVVCSALRQSFSLLVRPRGGTGLVAVVVAKSSEGAQRELREEASLVAATAIEELGAALERQRTRLEAASLRGPSELFRAQAVPGGAVSRPVTLEKGCTRFDVVGGKPLGHFAASLWRSDGVLLSETRGGAEAALFACTAKKIEARLEIVAEERAGPLAVMALRSDAPAVALANPRASARLLGRLDDAMGPVGPQHLGAIETVALDRDKRTPSELALTAGCIELVAANAGAPQGLELRLESARDDEMARVRGYGVVSARVCAGDGAARFTLRAGERTGSALVARVPR